MSTFPGTLRSSFTSFISTVAVVTPISCIRCGDNCNGARAGSEFEGAPADGVGWEVIEGPRATTGSCELASGVACKAAIAAAKLRWKFTYPRAPASKTQAATAAANAN